MEIDDEAIRRIVLSRPIPDRLIRNLARAPLVEGIRTYTTRYYGSARLTPTLYETLKLLCRTGGTNLELSIELGITREAARDRVKRLLAYFDVPNRQALVAKCYRERIV